jgi:hypothetical protein
VLAITVIAALLPTLDPVTLLLEMAPRAAAAALRAERPGRTPLRATREGGDSIPST